MINFNYETEFSLGNEEQAVSWLSKVIESENKMRGELNYIFCDDDYLHKINVEVPRAWYAYRCY
jgi:ssRNA-specific RNase YbeY (16S rRNA maturation enzyme)